jgi:hypothetical protein
MTSPKEEHPFFTEYKISNLIILKFFSPASITVPIKSAIVEKCCLLRFDVV